LGLPDVVAVLSQAYPKTDLEGLGRRATGSRLRLAADRASGVLLLDHTREVTTAMIAYLRRLRGGIAGALLVVDIDSEFERERLREWRRHALCMRMPLAPNTGLRRLLASANSALDRPKIEAAPLRQIIHTARGRVGWVCECAHLLDQAQYWRNDRLHVGSLCIDRKSRFATAGVAPECAAARAALVP
jgi:hypothetical protein